MDYGVLTKIEVLCVVFPHSMEGATKLKFAPFFSSLDILLHAAGYFLVGGKWGNLTPLDCCLPPLQIGSNNSVLYFPKDNTPPRPPYTGLHADINPPLQNIPRVYTLPAIDLSKTLQKAYQAKALSKRSRMALVSASYIASSSEE